ncbi:MAG: thiamine pyrophosphate-dependent enzyme [Armatimonadetes bacterium]|nr:thiamine pyrophosphate-dependent enzyme [Armatimonadota bacterium]MDW8120953.1 thiamine pyrophosphate-dependent enzyme [Armatimonadota bacterium]
MGRAYPDYEIEQLKYGKGEVLWADGCLAILKALLESGVSYVGGYPGAPVSNLTDAFLDAEEAILKPQGIFVANNVNEASAAAMLRISVNAPVRGGVGWKVVGTNVAADALAHICSSGVIGGVVIFVGEDYGANSTLVAQKTVPYGYNFGAPVIDPPADLNQVARLVRLSFDLSETCQMPVLFLVRTRVGNMKGWLRARDNKTPPINALQRLDHLQREPSSFPIPPYTQKQEEEKWTDRLPRAKRFIVQHRFNQIYPADSEKGIIVHGLLFNASVRALSRLGLVDSSRRPSFFPVPLDGEEGAEPPISFSVPIYCLSALFPVAEEEVASFLADKKEVLIVEEGEPALLEKEIRSVAQKIGWQGRLYRSEFIPSVGELTTDTLKEGFRQFFNLNRRANYLRTYLEEDLPVVRRPPNFCTGCPERPAVLTAVKLFKEKNPQARLEVVLDIGCYIMALYYLKDLVSPVTGMGTCLSSSLAAASLTRERTLYIVGDGTFWAQALTTSISNALYHKQDCVVLILENFWTAMTGHQPNPSSRNDSGRSNLDIEKTLKGMGAQWVAVVDPYDVAKTVRLLEEAWELFELGPRFLIARGECMLERSRRERKEKTVWVKEGKRVVDSRFGVDPLVCVGDHSCLHFNNCPSLTIVPSPNPLRRDTIVQVESSCVACGLCGSNAHAAKLCPSFYRLDRVINPSFFEKMLFRLRRWIIGL